VLVADGIRVAIRSVPVDDRVGQRHHPEDVRIGGRSNRHREHDAPVRAGKLAEADERGAVGEEDAIGRRAAVTRGRRGSERQGDERREKDTETKGRWPPSRVVMIASQHGGCPTWPC